MLRTKYDAEQAANELVDISVPEPVATARRAFVVLRDLRATKEATVAAAWSAAVHDLVDAAGRDDPAALLASLDLSGFEAARARDADSEARARLLAESVPVAGRRFAETVIAHERAVVKAIQAAHADVVKKLFATIAKDPLISESSALATRGDELARWSSINEQAEELARLRRLLGLVCSEQPTAAMNSLGWTKSSRIVDAWLRPVPGEPPTSFGTPGDASFWIALVRAGVPPSEVWCPLPSEAEQLGEQLDAAKTRERGMQAPLPRVPLRSL